MKKCYLCYYSVGEYEDHQNIEVFVTDDLNKAESWCVKFNDILEKWKAYYDQFCENKYDCRWIKDEFIEKHFDKWSQLSEIHGAYRKEIEFR